MNYAKQRPGFVIQRIILQL